MTRSQLLHDAFANNNIVRKRRSSRSSSKRVPLKMLPPTQGNNCRQLAVVPPSTAALTIPTTTPFRLPRGWRVEEVPRGDASRSDRYYYEPKTGRKFRSLRSVERHIRGEDYTPNSRAVILQNISPRCRKLIITNGKLLKLDEEVKDRNQLAVMASTRTSTASPYDLPDGWIVEEVPRRCDNTIDKYYYEPGTGRKFRSQIAVQRYLEEFNENRSLSQTLEVLRENLPLSRMFKVGYHTKNSLALQKEVTREKTRSSSFVSPPRRINWVISSPDGDAWDAFIGPTQIPDSVKKQWSKRFMLFMNATDSVCS